MEYLANVAYLLYLISYAVTDILWLRTITVVAAVLTLPYFYWQQSGPLWTSLVWAGAFAAINCVQLVRLILARRPIGLGAEERRLYEQVFARLDARAFTRLFGLGRWIEVEAGELLVATGELPASLFLLVEGEAAVVSRGVEIVTMRPTQFIGELAFMTGKSASASVRARRRLRCYAWPVAELRAHLEARPEVADAVREILGADVASKLHERNLSLDLHWP